MNRNTSGNKSRYNPNHIPTSERTINLVLSSILFVYGTFGVIADDLFIPSKRGPGTHLHGEQAYLMYAAFLCTVANLMSVVVDHYDKRNNETNYKLFARVTQLMGWILFVISLFWR